MGFYKPELQSPKYAAENRESSDIAFPLLIAYAQLGCVAWGILIMMTAKGLDIIAVVLAIWLLRAVSIISLITMPYYFTRYKGDNLTKKGIVIAGFAVGIIGWGTLSAWGA